MVAAIGTVGLSSIDTEARLRRIGSEWRELDAKARLIAQKAGTGRKNVGLFLARGQMELLDTDHGLHATLSMRPTVRARFLVPGETNRIIFDRRGWSEDYVFEVAIGDRSAQWRVSGETGWIELIDRTEREP